MLQLPAPIRAEIERLNAQTRTRWKPRRAHFVNIFRVREPETIWFADGKLFLDGSNGSGKSALMALLIPPVFDRIVSSERIDTAKSQSKRFAWHLIGAVPLEGEETERTGYVVLEMISPTGHPLVFGFGAQGVIGRDWTMWSFIVDGSLDEVRFMDDEDRPLGAKGMRAQMERLRGRFYDRRERDQYQDDLNDRLFKFSTREEYLDYVKFLTEIRRPGIAYGITVDRVERFIKDSLPAVPMDVIQKATGTYSEIVQMRARASETRRRAGLLSVWADAQYDVSEIRSIEAYEDWAEAAHRLKQAKEKLALTEARIESERHRLGDAEEALGRIRTRISELEGEKSSLEAQIAAMEGVVDLKFQIQNVKNEIAQWELQEKNARQRVSRAQDSLENAESDILSERTRHNEAERRYEEDLALFIQRYRSLSWPEFSEALRRIEAAPDQPLQLDPFRAEADRRAAKLHEIRTLTKQLEDADRSRRAATAAREEAATEAASAADHVSTSRRHWKAAATDYVTQVESDVQRLSEMATYTIEISQEDLPLADGTEGVRLYVKDAVEDALRPVHNDYEQQNIRLSSDLNVRNGALREATMRLAEIERTREALPALPPETEAARRALAAAGVTAIPLYAAVEPRDGVPAMAQLEEALIDSGLLNRLIIAPADRTRAREVLSRDGLGDAYLMPEGAPGALARYLIPCPETALEPRVIEAVLAAMPFQISANGMRWSLPGQEGFTTGLRADVEYLGARAREARRERLMGEVSAQIEHIQLDVASLEQQIQALEVRRDEFRSRIEGFISRPERRQILVGPWAELDRATKADTAASALEKRAIEREQKARQRHMEVDHRYKAVRAEERWLPPSNAAEAVLDDLDALLRSLPGEIKQLQELLTSVHRAAEAVQRSQARHLAANEEVAEAGRSLAEVERTLGGRRSERDKLQAALSEKLPNYEKVSCALAEVERHIKDTLGEVEQQNGVKSKAEQLLETLRDQVPEEQAAVLQEEGIESGRRSEFVRFLRGLPHLGHLLTYFEKASLDALHRQMKDLRGETGAEQWARARSEARERLRDAESEARPYFIGNTPEHDSFTEIPSFLDTETGEWVDIWTMAERLDLLAQSQEADMTDQMRSRIHALLGNELYGAVAHLLQQIEETEKNLNKILDRIELQRGAGNLRIHFKQGQTALDPRDTESATGAAMIAHFQARLWIYRNEAERERLVDLVIREIETAHRASLGGATQLSFEEVLRERLDYRRWFVTEVLRKEDDGEWVDLRSRHGEGSQGMKTMDLLQPMVACAHLRLLGAKDPHRPCIIAMDEVFAQLDDTHGTAILQVLKALDCDWVLATEKGLHPNTVLDGAACYTVDFNDGVLQVFPAVWTGEQFVNMGSVLPEDLVWLKGVREDGQFGIDLPDAVGVISP